MLDFGFYNMDCMEGMKDFPDNYFDLAIVDPPYGNAENPENTRGGYWNRFGQRFDRYKNPQAIKELSEAGRNMGLSELAEHGRANMQKNCLVGCSA